MNTLLKPLHRTSTLVTLVLLASIATPALADDDDGYRGRGYDAPRYQGYDRGDWGRGHKYKHHDRDVYYVTPYYQPRVVYAPPPA
ncbi:hypothetical protein CAP31_12675 [Sulfuriferula sp. AH1]|uniref:hypothetical protein n=1 Tax=Sulfuriferula sp. AH1 TaxID=1985873 RepID=UPI000B3B7A35|nr:hypothetical protein [Sulfuriferula sp. AH1]ARU32458.1 hypothetical protein CAP31_12675 [Sulfuriferula sp. AH1]